MTKRAPEEDWDFYPCEIDDAPASIFLNLRFERGAPENACTLYRLRVDMVEPDHHGMGTPAESNTLNALEDEIARLARDAGLHYAGRVRSRGQWELTFYAGPKHESAFDEIRKLLTDRKATLHIKPDADWGYYREFLFPDAERRQWMNNRRVTDQLQQRGDVLTTVRRVDHWAYFPALATRAAFQREAAKLGFESETLSDDMGDLRFGAQVYRLDSVELDRIHGVVMQLVEIAQKHGGEYDGWESPVETK